MIKVGFEVRTVKTFVDNKFILIWSNLILSCWQFHDRSVIVKNLTTLWLCSYINTYNKCGVKCLSFKFKHGLK